MQKKKKAQNHYLSERGKSQTSCDVSLHLLKWLLANQDSLVLVSMWRNLSSCVQLSQDTAAMETV